METNLWGTTKLDEIGRFKSVVELTDAIIGADEGEYAVNYGGSIIPIEAVTSMLDTGDWYGW